MVYLNMKDWELIGFRKSNKLHKKYDAILRNYDTNQMRIISFGDNRFMNYDDKTMLNAYPELIHRDKSRRKLFRMRQKHNLRKGFYSPSYFSFYYLW
jgi:hypothetical protein